MFSLISQLKRAVIKFTQLFDIYPNRSHFKQLKPLTPKRGRLITLNKYFRLILISVSTTS